MIEVKRIRHATFATPDIEAQIEYYQSIIGLGVVGKQDGRAYLVTNPGADASSREGGLALQGHGLRARSQTDLRDLCRRLENPGIKSHMRRTVCREYRGCWFSRTWTDARSSCSRSGNLPGPAREVGEAVNKLGHMALYAPDPELTAKFYEEVLGCRNSDRIEQNFVFMRSGSTITLSISHEVQTPACITWRSNCGMRPTCSRPAICSAAGKSRSCGARCVTVPGTTSPPIIAVPTDTWSSCTTTWIEWSTKSLAISNRDHGIATGRSVRRPGSDCLATYGAWGRLLEAEFSPKMRGAT